MSDDAVLAAREAVYDLQIAPKLLELCKLANDNGMGFIAVVEYNPGDLGRTSQLTPDHSFQMLTTWAAAQLGRNVDAMIGWLMDQGRKAGHSSIFLKQLGVPLVPLDPPPGGG